MRAATPQVLLLLLLLLLAAPLGKGKSTTSIGATIPHSTYKQKHRGYVKAFNTAITDLGKISTLSFTKTISFGKMNPIVPRSVNPNPSDTLNSLCQTFLPSQVCVIVYLSNSEKYGQQTAATLYFLQLAAYLGIPVVSYLADNAAMEQKHQNSLLLELAPTLRHQVAAMLSILKRYNWNQFSVITTKIPGHRDFELAVREATAANSNNGFKYMVLSYLKLEPTLVTTASSNDNSSKTIEALLKPFVTETRVFLLYVTQDEAVSIFEVADRLGLTGPDFVWIVTQSVVTDTAAKRSIILNNFPVGLLAVSYDTSEDGLQQELYKATKLIGYGIDLFINDPININATLQPNMSCTERQTMRWEQGRNFYRYLKNVSVPMGFGKNNMEFSPDGTLKDAELNILNLNNKKVWNKIGTWTHDHLEMSDIVWPGNSMFPPKGKPDKFHLHVTFLEEPPYINLKPPDPKTDECIDKGVLCRISGEASLSLKGIDLERAKKNTSMFQCCSGFCVDLLEKLSASMEFTYDLVRVEDGLWGAKVNGTWNGLVSALLRRQTDMVMTSLKINSQRESAVDFSVPFLETGIAVVVAKKTGIVSPSAFLEPFDTVSWLLILVVIIQIAGFAIFIFEWMSPVGYDMNVRPTKDGHQFSLFRAYWLVWATLFGAAVDVDVPRGFASKWMSGVWALFAVVFLAIYTANLAAFMITREEYYNLMGIQDNKLQNPFGQLPPFKFGTVRFGNTEAIIKENFPEMFEYIKHFNMSNVKQGVRAVKNHELDAFIYDSTVLEYLMTRDDECKLLTVGKWYARTGYGVAFPPKSRYIDLFNRQLLLFKENGELERLQKFWLSGACKPNEQEQRSSANPLGVMQFFSAFILLGSGVVLALVFLCMEHTYFRWIRRYITRANRNQCCSLISQNLGRSLSFKEAIDKVRQVVVGERPCDNPLCDIYFEKVKEELLSQQRRIQQLEKQAESHNTNKQKKKVKHKKQKQKIVDSSGVKENSIHFPVGENNQVTSVDESETFI